MKPLTDAEHSKARAIRLQQQINNTNKIIQNRKNNENKPNKVLETPLIKFSKSDILKKQNRLNTLSTQMAVSNKLMKASEDLEAGIIPQLADPRSTSEKLRDASLQTQTCISNCKLLLSDNEQANELFTYLIADPPLMMFFNYSFPDIKIYFDKKKNVLARTAIIYIQQLWNVNTRTGGVNNPVQQQDYEAGVGATMNAVYQTGMAGMQEARDMNNDNINNLNNAGAMLVNEMRNNVVPQINILHDLRNEIVDMNIINIDSRGELLNKLDALIAVVDQDNTAEMQQAFEQAYTNLNLPTNDDIDNIIEEMNDNTEKIGVKIDSLGGLLSTVTIQNLESVLSSVRGEKAGKRGKPERTALDDFISRAFTVDTFNNDPEAINEFANAYNIETTTSRGKQRALSAVVGDIYTTVVKYFKIIRKHELSGETKFSTADLTSLEKLFGDLRSADRQEELMTFYLETQARLDQVMTHRGAATLNAIKATPDEKGAVDTSDIKLEGEGLRKKQKNKKKIVKKVKRKTRYIYK